MKKLHAHTEFSNKECADCKKPLKLNLLEKLPKAKRCYRCHDKHTANARNRAPLGQRPRNGRAVREREAVPVY